MKHDKPRPEAATPKDSSNDEHGQLEHPCWTRTVKYNKRKRVGGWVSKPLREARLQVCYSSNNTLEVALAHPRFPSLRLPPLEELATAALSKGWSLPPSAKPLLISSPCTTLSQSVSQTDIGKPTNADMQ